MDTKCKFNSERLQGAFEEAGLSNGAVDRRLEWNNQAYKYTNGTHTPTPEVLYKILFAVGKTIEELKEERLIDWYPLNGTP
jgi:hypothetical protein